VTASESDVALGKKRGEGRGERGDRGERRGGRVSWEEGWKLLGSLGKEVPPGVRSTEYRVRYIRGEGRGFE